MIPISMKEKPRQLYRDACVTAQSSKNEGDVIIPPSLNITLFSCASVILVLTIFVFMIKGEYTRKAHLEGIVMPSTGIVKIEALSGGYVTQLLVQEGECIKARQVLYHLSGEYYGRQGTGTLAAVALSLTHQYHMLEHQREQERAANSIQQLGIRHRIEKLNDELISASVQLKLAQQQATLWMAESLRCWRNQDKRSIMAIP